MRHGLVFIALFSCKAEETPTPPPSCTGVSGHVDRDGDGFGDPVLQASACAEPVVDDGTDCDDSTATANPDAPEICDGLDNDCDGLVDLDDDDGDVLTIYQDLDGDGYGTGPGMRSCELLPHSSELDGDCDDDDPDASPETPEVCDGVDNNCDGLADDDDPATVNVPVWFLDEDHDGFAGGSVEVSCVQPPFSDFATSDCDDTDPLRYPGAVEICDNADQNCDSGPDFEMFGFDVCATFEGEWEGTWTATITGDDETVLCTGTAQLTLDRSLSPPVQGSFTCTLNSNPAGWAPTQTGAITASFLEDGFVIGSAAALEGQTYDWAGATLSEDSLDGSGSGLFIAADTWSVDFTLSLGWPIQ